MTLPVYLSSLAETCRSNLLEPKWLLAPKLRIASQWKDRIAFSGIPVVNLHPMTMQSLVLDRISPWLVDQKLEFATNVRCELLMTQIARELTASNRLQYFNRLENTTSLGALLAKTISEIRLANLNASFAAKGELEDPLKAADLKILMVEFESRLAKTNQIDYAGCLQAAINLLETNEVRLPEDLVLISPLQLGLSHLEGRLIEVLSSRCRLIEPPESSEKTLPVEANFFSALGETNEVEQIIRMLFEDLPGSRLDDVEILHKDSRTYLPLIYELLSARTGKSNLANQDLPVTFGEGIPCVYSRPGRSLRSWVRWIRHDFLQPQIVLMIREGLLAVPEMDTDSKGSSFTQLAHHLRRLPIGLGAGRYPMLISDAIQKAEGLIADRNKKRRRTRGKRALQKL